MSFSTPMRRLIAAAAAGIVALSLTACGGGSPAPQPSNPPSGGGSASEPTGEVIWSTWGNPEELTRYKEFNEEFMKRHPGIKVELQPVASYGEYHSKLLAQLTSRTAPDVFYIGDDKLGQFTSAKVLMPLNDKMAGPLSQTKADDFFQGTFGAARIDGETYAAPNDVNPDVLWYDKAALTAAGVTEDPAELAASDQWTTAKFLEINDKLAAAGLVGTMTWHYWATHWSWVSAQGGTSYNEAGEFVGNTDPKTVAAVETLGKYFQDKKFQLADDMPEGAGADSMFVTHKAGFFIQGRYTIGTLKSAGVQDGYDIVRWPTPDGNGGTKNPDAAFLFWTEFLSADGQIFRLAGGGNAVPSIKGADEVVLEDGIPAHAQTFLDMRDIGFANYPAEATTPGLSDDINTAFYQLYQGKADAQGTLDAVAALVTAAK